MNEETSNLQRRPRSLPAGTYRERCYDCYRPASACFCDSIPQVDNQTQILILQHQRERTHPFNTARIVKKALSKCELLFARNDQFAKESLPIQTDAALLYPGKNSQLLDDIPPQDQPSQLVLIDGTWDQARTLFRDVPQLRELRQVHLSPTQPGQYRIRREPTETSLSTLEATVQALQQIESDTIGLKQLITSFNAMVEQQLQHPQAKYDAENLGVDGTTLNIPSSFLRPPENIVVCYGEATPVEYQRNEGWADLNLQKKANSQLPPVFWAAARLSVNPKSISFFSKAIEPPTEISTVNLEHMQLTKADFEQAVTLRDFRTLWSNFLRSGDLLVVPNQRTIKLLSQTKTAAPSFETLKSINYDPNRDFENLSEYLDAKGCHISPVPVPGRAGKRLANSIALVHYLISQLGR